jgi:hypothetical protein
MTAISTAGQAWLTDAPSQSAPAMAEDTGLPNVASPS